MGKSKSFQYYFARLGLYAYTLMEFYPLNGKHIEYVVQVVLTEYTYLHNKYIASLYTKQSLNGTHYRWWQMI